MSRGTVERVASTPDGVPLRLDEVGDMVFLGG
jgi:hypothetical protein